MNDQQSASSVGGASSGTDFQPPTQNPQSNVNSNLQTTGTGLQTAANSILSGQQNIYVPTASGATIKIAPTNAGVLASHTSVPKHPPVIAWVGAAIVVGLLIVMAVGILRPHKY